jgi:hypothetical protein
MPTHQESPPSGCVGGGRGYRTGGLDKKGDNKDFEEKLAEQLFADENTQQIQVCEQASSVQRGCLLRVATCRRKLGSSAAATDRHFV